MDNYEDFISTVSHELRTPLTSIRGFSQTMLASWDKLDDESKKKFLKIIEDQSNRLINLVENMLSVTKLHSQKENLIYKDVQ
ncbi:MAG: histidine kinase dimerization/phospho-acceptor domain-containing protein [Candidatus Gastranaerophilaceae bacterium]